MMPAAIDRLPYYKKKEVIEDPLFPLLLELYRCDLSSSFHGLDGYYEACRYYKGFMKNKKNPYRQSDGSLKKGAV
jgi:poly(A) polymerase